VDGGRLDLYGELKPAVAKAVGVDGDDSLNYTNGELWEGSESCDQRWRVGGVCPPKVILDDPNERKIGLDIEVQCFLLCSG